MICKFLQLWLDWNDYENGFAGTTWYSYLLACKEIKRVNER